MLITSRWIVCQSRRLRQITDLRDTDISPYFAVTEFIQSLSLFSSTRDVKALSHSSEKWCMNVICGKTHLSSITHEQSIICRQLFGGLSASENGHYHLMQFFFLFTGWKPHPWLANNCLQIMVLLLKHKHKKGCKSSYSQQSEYYILSAKINCSGMFCFVFLVASYFTWLIPIITLKFTHGKKRDFYTSKWWLRKSVTSIPYVCHNVGWHLHHY